MATTIDQAIKQMHLQVKAAWDVGSGAATGESPKPLLIFEENDRSLQPDERPAGSFGRMYIRHEEFNQSSLGGIGNRLFLRSGSIYVQVFAPWEKKVPTNGPKVARALAGVVLGSLEGKSTTDVWFRHARMLEVGRDGPWYQVNVVSNFEWNERK